MKLDVLCVRQDARSQISTTLLAAREKGRFAQSRFPDPLNGVKRRAVFRQSGDTALRLTHYFSGYCAVYPPSTMMSWPVVNAAPGELSQSTALAISSGVPMRPTGFCVAIVFFTSVSYTTSWATA